MKILVPVKRVLDHNVKVKIKPDNQGLDLFGLKMSLNPFDEIALEEATRLKEQGIAAEVIAVSCGSSQCQDVLRTAMALGADRSILIHTEADLQPIDVATLIRPVVMKEQPDLVILGKQAIDDDSNQTGQMLAALLDWPQATFASKISIDGKNATVTREVDGGHQILSLALPAVVTADLRLNEPRYVALPSIMKAKKKPIDVLTPEELSVEINSRIRILSYREPVQRRQATKVPDVATLLEKLKQEANAV